MDSFKVKIPGMRNVISEQEKMIRELSGLQNNLDDVKRSLRFKIAGRQRIDSRLKEQSGRTSEMRQQMSGITSALADITALYEQTEMALCQNGKQQSETRQKEKQQSAEQQQSKEKAGGTTETFIGSTASYEFGRDADDDEGIEIGVRIRETYTDSAFQDEVVLGNKDGTHLSHELTIGKTEAYGEAFAEICTIDPETGETIFNPAIGYVGASTM